jgi:hypothetical protein
MAGLLCVCTTDAEDKPKSASIKPLMTMYGRNSKITKEKVLRVLSAKEWKDLWIEHKLGFANPKDVPRDFEFVEFDFDKIMVIAVFGGQGSNQAGYTAYSISDDGRRITIRIDANPYSTGFPGDETQAWGILVLPQSDKEIVLQRNAQIYKHAPPSWEKWTTFPAMPLAKNR